MKKMFALLLAMMLVLSLCACGATESQQTEPEGTTTAAAVDPLEEEPVMDEGLMQITVTVVHSDGSTKDFTYQTPDSSLGVVLVENGLIEGNDGPYGLEITKVDGEEAVYEKDKAYWAIYEEGEYATSGVDGIAVVDGANYKLEYTRD